MSSSTSSFEVRVGSRIWLDGQGWEIAELDGAAVRLHAANTVRTVSLSTLAQVTNDHPEPGEPPVASGAWEIPAVVLAVDVFALEPVTLRWVNTELTVAMDLFDRCITRIRLRPVAAQSPDVASVLFHHSSRCQELVAGSRKNTQRAPRACLISSRYPVKRISSGVDLDAHAHVL